jgi:hypothetical protein
MAAFSIVELGSYPDEIHGRIFSIGISLGNHIFNRISEPNGPAEWVDPDRLALPFRDIVMLLIRRPKQYRTVRVRFSPI